MGERESESTTEETVGRSGREGKRLELGRERPDTGRERGREEEGEAGLRPAGSRSIGSEGVKRRNNGRLS